MSGSYLQLEDALLDGARDDEARDVDGLELAQAVDAVLRLLLHRRVPPARKFFTKSLPSDGEMHLWPCLQVRKSTSRQATEPCH